MRIRKLCVGTLVAVVSSVLPVTAQAGVRWVGPSLIGQRATLAESAPVDDVFALTRPRMPVSGKVVSAQIEGFVALTHGAAASPVDTMFHLQDLTPAGGRWQPRFTSGFLRLPTSAKVTRSAETRITTVYPVNLCVHKGDLVDFTTDGGFHPPGYPHGLPFQVFAPTSSSMTARFVGAGLGGGTFALTPLAGKQLLMRVQIGTGKAAGVCAAVEK
jgi:hypothetical protein